MASFYTILHTIFDPTPMEPMFMRNYFIYLFIILIGAGLYNLYIKKKEKGFQKVLISYAALGLFLLWIRYENVPFFSMRLIFAGYLAGSMWHLVSIKSDLKKNENVEVIVADGEEKKVKAPEHKAKVNKGKKNRKRKRK